MSVSQRGGARTPGGFWSNLLSPGSGAGRPDLLDFGSPSSSRTCCSTSRSQPNETRSLGAANIEAFLDALGGYLAVDDLASPGFLLAPWRNGADNPRRLEWIRSWVTVQLLTIHGSKGLEWDSRQCCASSEGGAAWFSLK
jgi:hypothetical protein